MTKLREVHYKVPASIHKKVVLISDIHYYDKRNEQLLQDIYEHLKTKEMDYICIPGDYIDERMVYDTAIFLRFLKNLASLAPVILSVGNHELKSIKGNNNGEVDPILTTNINKLENVHLLNNASWIHDGIRFTGITFPLEAYHEKKSDEKVVAQTIEEYYPNGLKKDRYNLVLSHSPYQFTYPLAKKTTMYKSIDFILSGHTHGGLTPGFILQSTNKVFTSPMRHLLKKNSYGYLKEEKTIVSSGITKLSHTNPFRMFNFLYSGEIVFITFEKDSI